nr:serine/threonine/dual specificity protein kinase, catalytic domain-containing protein [Tanacetum cinerariifolium]
MTLAGMYGTRAGMMSGAVAGLVVWLGTLSKSLTQLEIQSATKNFDHELCIGKGGFGKVYKGQFSSEVAGHFVAIKRLDSMSNQGEPEFKAELEIHSKLRHCHLVPLIGFCDDNKEMILIYNYMPHGALSHHLHKAKTPLSWAQRLKIAVGAGSGLQYLHTHAGNGIIHRDVKSSNILLDENWEAMISDFGLSKPGPTNQSKSYVDASVKGTFGGFAKTADRCLLSDPKKRPTMTQIVASLQALLELQTSDVSVKSPRSRGLPWKIYKHPFSVIKQGSDQCGTSSRKSYEENMNGRTTINKYGSDHGETTPHQQEESVTRDIIVFTYSDLKLATRNFSVNRRLGFGFKGTVYRGWVDKITYPSLKNTTESPIAVRELSHYKHFDLELFKQFRHPNVAQLIGYCINNRNLFLVYEYMCNRNLKYLLRQGVVAKLPLATKIKIAVGIARGIVFLKQAQLRVLDIRKAWIKRKKIYLDEDFMPKISGYEFPMLAQGFFSHSNTSKASALPCNVSSFIEIFTEVLTGKEFYHSTVKNDCKKLLQGIAKSCFETCNEVDAESKMLTILDKYDKHFPAWGIHNTNDRAPYVMDGRDESLGIQPFLVANTGKKTPLFPTIVRANQVQMGKGSAQPTDTQHTPTFNMPQPKPKRIQKPRQPKRKTTKVSQPSESTYIAADEDVLKQGVTVCLKHIELMKICTTLQKKVLDLEDELKRMQTAQQSKIDGLERKVRKLEKKHMSRTHKLKRLYNVGLTARVISSFDDEALDKKDTSKHARIDKIDADEDIALMLIDTVVDVAQVITAITDVSVSAVETIVTTAPTITAESTKINVEVTQASKRKEVMIQEPDETTTTKTTSSQQPQVHDKGKGKAQLIEEHVKLKKKDQILFDEELTRKLLQAKEQEQLTDAEKAKLFMELLEKRRKFFAAKRTEEKRNRPPTKAQQKKSYVYLFEKYGWMEAKSFEEQILC